MTLYLKYYGPAILWALFVLILCCVSFGGVGKSHLFFPGFDKLVHCCLFVVLALFYNTGSLSKRHSRTLSITTAITNLIILVVYGALIEVLQKYFFTWRSAEWDDLFCDTVGICIGTFGVMMTAHAVNYEKN